MRRRSRPGPSVEAARPGIAPAEGIRGYNRKRVLAAFDGVAGLTRAELARRTGLSRTTVTAIVNELVAEGLVRTHSPVPAMVRDGGPGRRPAVITRTRQQGYGIGVDLGHEYVQVAIADLGGRVFARRTVRVSESCTATSAAARTREVVQDLILRAGLDAGKCSGVVAAIPEPIGRDGRIARENVAERWHGTNPGDLLSETLGIATHAENDVNLAVLGETVFGASRGVPDVLYVKIAHGVGCGIVVNGRLVRGTDGLAGEIGHTQARPDGVVCTCGNRGCLYTLASSHYLTQALHAVTNNPNLTLEDLATMGESGHPGAGRVLRDAGREVGRVLANLCNTLNPRHVVVGGSLTRAGDWAITGLRETMADYTEARVAQALEIRHGSLGERAEVYGAIAMAVGIVDPESAGVGRSAETRDPAVAS